MIQQFYDMYKGPVLLYKPLIKKEGMTEQEYDDKNAAALLEWMQSEQDKKICFDNMIPLLVETCIYGVTIYLILLLF